MMHDQLVDVLGRAIADAAAAFYGKICAIEYTVVTRRRERSALSDGVCRFRADVVKRPGGLGLPQINQE